MQSKLKYRHHRQQLRSIGLIKQGRAQTDLPDERHLMEKWKKNRAGGACRAALRTPCPAASC